MDFYGSTGLLAGLSFNLAKIYFSLYAPFFQGENSTLRTKISTCNIFIEILFEISRARRGVCFVKNVSHFLTCTDCKMWVEVIVCTH